MPFLINGVPIELKVDSGADVNVISWACYQEATKGKVQPLELQDSEVTLVDYGGNEIGCAGCVKTTISTPVANERLLETFHVATSRPQSVLSFETATKLGVLKMTSTVMQIKSIERFPTIPIEPIKLKIDEEVTPRICIYNNIPAALEPFIDDHWDTLEQKGVIEPVPGTPKWLSRVDVAPKKDGTHRVIIDMRPANKAIARKYYQMPNPDRAVSKIRGAKRFTKFDFRCAYHHVLLHSESRYITAFMTRKGARQFTRLPFGINCAPEIFQQIMDNLFGGLEGVIVYLDDVLVYAPDQQTLELRVEAVLKVVKDNNLTLNDEKCIYNATQVEFLGSILSEEGCVPSPERINGIRDFPRPETYTELREFVGLVNYVAKHIYDISTMMEPMRRLLTGDASKLKGARLVGWGQEQEDSFNLTKKAATEDILVRGYYDSNHLTKITTDASPVGIAAIVVQVDTSLPLQQQTERVIACTSRSLTQTERKYPQTQREALALSWGVPKNRYYLAGTKFVIVTDHEPLKYIFSNDARKDLSKRAANRSESYAMSLSQYNFEVEIIRSAENRADILSRCPAATTHSNVKDGELEGTTTAMVWTLDITPEDLIYRNASLIAEEIREATGNDQQLQKVIQALDGQREWDEEVAPFTRFKNELQVVNNTLLRGDRMVVPGPLQAKAMRVAHRSHPGMSTTKHLLRKYVWWPGMDRAVENFIQTCSTCIKLSTCNPPEPMLMSNFPDSPWCNLAIDFWSGGEADPKVLVVADYYSKAMRAEVMKETTSSATIRALEKIFNELGWPRTIKHDNGPQLVSDMFLGWMRNNGITSIATTPRNAQENGLVERHMSGITRALAIAKIEKQRPEEALRLYICDYNSWPHTVTQLAPRDVLSGRIVKSRFPLVLGTEKHHSFDSIARERDLKFKARQKEREDMKRRARNSDLKVGEVVYIRDHERRFKTDANFLPEKHEVTARSGGRLTLKSLVDGRRKIRKTVDVKKVPTEEHDGTGRPSQPEAQAELQRSPLPQTGSAPVLARAQRVRIPVQHFVLGCETEHENAGTPSIHQ